MKKLNWYDVREIEKIQIKDDDRQIVDEYFDDNIELFYCENTYRVYSENGDYIADIEKIIN